MYPAHPKSSSISIALCTRGIQGVSWHFRVPIFSNAMYCRVTCYRRKASMITNYYRKRQQIEDWRECHVAECTCWKKYTLTVSSGKASAFVSMCTSDTEIAPSFGSTFTHMPLHITFWLVLFILLTILLRRHKCIDRLRIHATCATLLKSRYDCLLHIPYSSPYMHAARPPNGKLKYIDRTLVTDIRSGRLCRFPLV